MSGQTGLSEWLVIVNSSPRMNGRHVYTYLKWTMIKIIKLDVFRSSHRICWN